MNTRQTWLSARLSPALRQALWILLLSFLGLGLSLWHHSPSRLLAPPPNPVLAQPTPVPPDLARELVLSGQALPIDARPREAWQQGHLPQAVSIPLMEALAPEYSWPVIPENLPLLVYCSGPACGDARDLCALLAQRGHTRLLLFEGGWEAWNLLAEQEVLP